MEKILPFLIHTLSMSAEEFEKRFPHPFLITSKSKLRLLYNKGKVTSLHTYNKFATAYAEPQHIRIEEEWLRQGWVIPVVSSKASFAQMITIGRTSNNDIVIPLPMISKLHACILVENSLEKKQQQQAFLMDGGSTNGTYLNGQRIVSHVKISLKNGYLLRFGQILEFEFYFSSDFYKNLPLFRQIVGIKTSQ
ncbi:MAG: FHA domain-containing protein [Planctomycetota bacterium]|nr:MAG: FHA domain-containing protein [Planctomycetota bacterium]